MLKYIIKTCLYFPFVIIAFLVAPLLPAFAVMRDGPTDNNNNTGVEPRLPNWLFWFDTTYDNSLWGDKGWRTKHAPNLWNTYIGMICWLWRNPAAGFSWSVLAADVSVTDTYTVNHSGDYLDVDKNKRRSGWFFIKSNTGLFQFRWVNVIGKVIIEFEAGWLLDVYVKNNAYAEKAPKAVYMFQPGFKIMK